MSQTNSGMDTQSLLLSMLQRMQINSSSSSSFSIENDQDGQQSLAAEETDGGVCRPIPKWGRGRPDDIGTQSMIPHPTPAVGAKKNTNEDPEDNYGISGNLGGSLPLTVDWDPTSGIPRWGKRQTLPPPVHLDALTQNCESGKENQTPENLPREDPVLTPLCARLRNSVPSTMWVPIPKRDGQHKLAYVVGDKARWDMKWSQGTSVIWRDPVQMSPWARGTGSPPLSEQEGVSEVGEIISPGLCRNIWKQGFTGACNPNGPLERSANGLPLDPPQGADACKDDSDPITSPSALKQSSNPTDAMDIPNPGGTSGVSDSETQNSVIADNGNSTISAQTLDCNSVAGPPTLGMDSEWSSGIACGREGNLGGGPRVVEWDDVPEALTTHQNLWENIPSRKMRRETDRKTATWTERIKDRWRDRRKSLGKIRMGQRSGVGAKDDNKRRDEGKEEPQFSHLTWHRIMDTNVCDAPTTEKELTLQSPINAWPNKSSPTQSEGSNKGRHMSTSNESEFSFAPVDLMEEIFTVEEWSNFLSVRRCPTTMWTANQSAMDGDCTQLNQKNDQPEMLRIPCADSQWDFTPGDINRIVDRNTIKMYSNGQPAANKEAIEHMLIQSRAYSGSGRTYPLHARDQSQGRIPKAPSDMFTKPMEILDNAVKMTHIPSNRKREHSSGNGSESMRSGEGEGAGQGGRVDPEDRDPTVNTGLPTAEARNETREGTIPLHVFQDSSLPSMPRSALRSTVVSSSSSETVIKKRKMGDGREDTRRVHFAEQPVYFPYLQPFEFNTPKHSEQPSLPSWILALKGKRKQKPRH